MMGKRTLISDAGDGEPAFVEANLPSVARRKLKHFVASVFYLTPERPLLVGVLGPSTSSVVAARHLTNLMPKRTPVRIVSFPTFDQLLTAAIGDPLSPPIDLSVVPHAAPIVNSFYMSPRLYPALIFPFSTPVYGLAAPRGKNTVAPPAKIAIFPTTIPVLADILPDYAAQGFELCPVNSTGAAAAMVAGGQADFALTNEEAVKQFGLHFERVFGRIPMCWTVFARRKALGIVSVPYRIDRGLLPLKLQQAHT